jgi:hypothetical protein
VNLYLISATSIFALLSASIGPAQAAVLSVTPSEVIDIYDLVHDGVTSADGGDNTVTRQDLSTSAVIALRIGTKSWQAPSFTGKTDLIAAAGKGYPAVPLGAAPGSKPNDELASAVVQTGPQDAVQRARAIGRDRIASLIGTVGTGPAVTDKSGNTVFVAVGSAMAFNDGNGSGQGSTAYTFAPGSTSTATITVAGAGNFSRQRGGSAPYVAAANSLQVTSPVATENSRVVALTDSAQPTLGYNYAPAANTVAKANAVSASFSDAVTASGLLAQNMNAGAPGKIQISQTMPIPGQSTTGKSTNGRILTGQVQPTSDQPVNGKVQTSQVQQNRGQAGPLLTVDASNFNKLIDLTQATPGSNDTQGDGSRILISTSVSANPTLTAARYMATVVNAARAGQPTPSVEAFEVGPAAGQKTQAMVTTTVSDPIHGKIMASAGALNNSLALP